MLSQSQLCILVLCVSVQSVSSIVDDPLHSEYYDDGTPFVDDDDVETAPAVRDQADCDKAASLENILEVMISMLRKDVSDNVKSTLILKALTDLLKNTSPYNDEVMYKINDLVRTLDKYKDPDGDESKLILRTGPKKVNTTPVKTMVRQRKPNGNIRLKYELPSFRNPLCTEALLNIIKVVYQAYVSFAKSPICKSNSVSILTLPSILDKNNIAPFILKPESIQNPDYHLNPNDHHSKPHSEESTSSPPKEYQPFYENNPKHRIILHPTEEHFPDTKYDPYPHPQHPNIFGHLPHSKIPYPWTNGSPFDKESESSPLNPYFSDDDTPQNVNVPETLLDKIPKRPHHPKNNPEDVSKVPLIPETPLYTYHVNPHNNNAPVPVFTNGENLEGSQVPYKTIPTRPYPFEIKPRHDKIHLSPFVELQKSPKESFVFPLETEPEGYLNEMIPDTHNYLPTDDENPVVHGPKTHVYPFKIIPHTKKHEQSVKTHPKKPFISFESTPDNVINYLYPHNQHPVKNQVFEPEKTLWSDSTDDAEPEILELPYHNHVTSQPNADLPNGEVPEFIPIQSLLNGLHGPDITLNPNRPYGPTKTYGPNRPYLSNHDVLNPNNLDNLSNPEDDGTLEPNESSPNEPYFIISSDDNPINDFEFPSDQLHPKKNPNHPVHLTYPDEAQKRPEYPHIHYNNPNNYNPDYPDSETHQPIYDLTHSDKTLKHPLSKLIPYPWHLTGSEAPAPGYTASYVSDPTAPPKTELVPSVRVIGFIRDAIEVIEGLIPAVKFDSSTLVIIAKIKNILVQKDTDINNDELGTILKLYKKLINYVKQLNEYREIIDNFDLPRVTNLSKLETEKIVELTYLVKRPQPLIYYPYYYVKYKLPYKSLVFVQNLLKNKPHLRINPQKLHKELLGDSKIDETSPDLNNLKKNDLLKLTVDTGSLVGAKIVGGNEELNKQLDVLREITSDFTSEAILNTNDTKFTLSKLETEDNHQTYNVNVANNYLNTKENKHSKINDDHSYDIRWHHKQNEQINSLNPESLRDGSTMIDYGNFPVTYTPAKFDLDFTSFDSEKLRSDVLRGENVGLPYSDYVMPDVSPLEGTIESIPKQNQGLIAPVMPKLIDATLKASSSSRLREANQQNFLNNGGLVSSDSDQISLNSGTGNKQTGVTILSPKIMINQASINHAETNSDVTEANAESNNQQNSVITQNNHQEIVKQHNMWNQQNYLNLGGLVNFNHQNISLNAGEGNLQDNVSYISPEVMVNDMKHDDDRTLTSKAPTDSLYANFKPESDLTNQQESMGDINVPTDNTNSNYPNKYGQSGIGSGNLEGMINNNPENMQEPISNDNLSNAESNFPDSRPTNAQEITDMIKNSVKKDVTQYADSEAGKEISKDTYNQNIENPNDPNIYKYPITSSTASDHHGSFTGATVPHVTPGFNTEPLNSASQGIYGLGPGTWNGMGQSSTDNHNSDNLSWGTAAYQQNIGNNNPGVLANQQNSGYGLGLLSQQNVKGYNLGALSNQQNLVGYNFGALSSQTGYNMGVHANQQNMGAASNHPLLGGYNGHQYNVGGYSTGAGQGLGFQASQQNIANFGAGGVAGHQVNYMFQSMPVYYKRPLVPTRLTFVTPTYRRPVAVGG